MALPVAPINLSLPPIAPIAPSASPVAPKGAGGDAFQAVFSDAVAKVESFQANAQQSVDRFLSGEGEELHQVALKTQQADLSFELFMQVRNKVVAAYQEVMRMQI
jgi:flagellar hook-basal body complex protein FliE